MDLRVTRRPVSRRIFPSFIAVMVLGAGAVAAEAPFRVCADPDNMPFTSEDPAKKGFYLDLAEALAREIGTTVEPVWWRTDYIQRMLRATLLAKKCDAYFGLPHDGGTMGPRLIYSKPFGTLGYVVVVPLKAEYAKIADLHGKRVGVQFGSPTQILLASDDKMNPVTFPTAEAALGALRDGHIDAAYVWGPSAGYANKTEHKGAFEIITLSDEKYAWPVSIAFERGNAQLRDKVDAALAKLGDTIAALEARYGFPRKTAKRADSAAMIELAAVRPAGGDAERAPAAGAASRAIQLADTNVEARMAFNSNCGHCHGPDAESPDSKTNLRRLHKKHGAEADQVFATTVKKGRPAKGMPAWDGMLEESELAIIKKYVDSVQEK